jgi:hypothetical protein
MRHPQGTCQVCRWSPGGADEGGVGLRPRARPPRRDGGQHPGDRDPRRGPAPGRLPPVVPLRSHPRARARRRLLRRPGRGRAGRPRLLGAALPPPHRPPPRRGPHPGPAVPPGAGPCVDGGPGRLVARALSPGPDPARVRERVPARVALAADRRPHRGGGRGRDDRLRVLRRRPGVGGRRGHHRLLPLHRLGHRHTRAGLPPPPGLAGVPHPRRVRAVAGALP